MRGDTGEQSFTLVLVVDDDRQTLETLRQAITRSGCQIAEAPDGAEGLSAFERLGPDMVVLGARIPVVDGFAVCTRLRELSGGDRLPVLMVTLPEDQQSIDRALEAGVTDVITMPINVNLVRNRVQYLLGAAHIDKVIERAKKEWEATFDAVSDVIVLTDPEGQIIRCNRATVEQLQTSFRRVIGRPIRETIFGDVEPDGEGAWVRTGEMELPRLGRYCDVSRYPIHLQDSLYGVVYVIRDIAERKQMEAQLVASQKLADLGRLAAGIAHEINSPLQVITGVSRSLMDRLQQGTLASERLERNLDVIHRSGWRCVDIVRALRTYAHASAAQIEPSDLNEMVEDTLLLIENQLKSWSNISVGTDLTPDLPPLRCDRNQITQVLINLLTNARDAMPEGGQITIGTSYDAESARLVLAVSDTGVGIAESIKANLFDPFFTTKPAGEGTGLGLSIVAGIVRAHAGEIDVNSVVGEGTTFTVYLPDRVPEVGSSSSPSGGRSDATPYSELSTGT